MAVIWKLLGLLRFIAVSHRERRHHVSAFDQVLLNARIGWAIYFGG